MAEQNPSTQPEEKAVEAPQTEAHPARRWRRTRTHRF